MSAGTPDGSPAAEHSGVDDSGAHVGTAGPTDGAGDWPDSDAYSGFGSGIFGAVAIGSLPSGHGVTMLAVDDTNLYWTDVNGGWVTFCPKSACTNLTVLAGNQGGPYGIAVDATSVYWTNFNVGQVMKCPIAGCNGNPTVLASSQSDPSFIAVDGTNVYWTNSGTTQCTTPNCSGPAMSKFGGQIAKCAIGGCGESPTVLAYDVNDPAGIAVDATNVYWADFTSGQVKACAIGGCNEQPTLLASGQTAPYSVAVDGVNVYWTNWGSDWATSENDPATLMACAKGGCGNAPTTLSSATSSGHGAQAFGVATDGTAVYWTPFGEVVRVPVAGSDGGTVIENGYGPHFIAVDATNVYWGNGTFAFVMKTPK